MIGQKFKSSPLLKHMFLEYVFAIQVMSHELVIGIPQDVCHPGCVLHR